MHKQLGTCMLMGHQGFRVKISFGDIQREMGLNTTANTNVFKRSSFIYFYINSLIFSMTSIEDIQIMPSIVLSA